MWTVMSSPIGDLRIIERDGALSAIEFTPFRHPPTAVPSASAVTTTAAGRGREPASAYFDRDLKEFDLPLDPQGSDFQRRVWDQLLTIGYGDTASYGEIAAGWA